MLLSLVSCSWEEYPKDNYTINSIYSDLIKTLKVGDTLTFQNNKLESYKIIVSKIDSLLHMTRGYFINSREHKSISVYYREVNSVVDKKQEDKRLILITKYPDESNTHFNIELQNVISINSINKTVVLNDTIIANNLKISNYIVFKTEKKDIKQNSISIEEIYMTPEKGIVGYRTQDNSWWTRK